MTRHLDCLQVTLTHLVRDADRSSRTDTHSQHERQIAHLVRYMVSR